MSVPSSPSFSGRVGQNRWDTIRFLQEMLEVLRQLSANQRADMLIFLIDQAILELQETLLKGPKPVIALGAIWMVRRKLTPGLVSAEGPVRGYPAASPRRRAGLMGYPRFRAAPSVFEAGTTRTGNRIASHLRLQIGFFPCVAAAFVGVSRFVG